LVTGGERPLIVNVLRAVSTTTEGVKSLPIKGCSIENPFIYSFDEENDEIIMASTSRIDQKMAATVAATATVMDVKSELRRSVRLSKKSEIKV
jgi:hypothetical protein